MSSFWQASNEAEPREIGNARGLNYLYAENKTSTQNIHVVSARGSKLLLVVHQKVPLEHVVK